MVNLQSIENTILDIAKAVKVISFYPEGHPSLNKVLEKIAKDISTYCEGDKLIIEVTKDAFVVKNTRISLTNPVIRDFLQALFLRRVNKIIFSCGIKSDELYEFLNLLTIDISNIFSAGGLETIIDGRNIKNIALSERQFIKHQESKESVRERIEASKPIDEPVFDVENINLNVLEQASQAPISIEKSREADEKYWQRIKDALEDAALKNDVGIYIENLKDVDGLTERVEENVELFVDIFYTISQHASDERFVNGIKREAESFVRDKLSNERVKKLLDLILTSQEKKDFVNKIHNIFLVLGVRVVDMMIDRLSSSNDIKERHFIINEIITMGESAFERVIYYLDDDRWFVVRNMLTILGFAGKEKYLPYLYKLIEHPDGRVRKELIKTFARIPGKQSLRYLREMLKKEADDVKQLVIFSLGILKDAGAVDDIIKELGENNNISIRKEALLALGRIGSPKSFEILKDYATKKTFFNKSVNKILRLSAIEGLSEIKGKEIEKILEKLIKDSDIEIREKAFDALQRIRI